MVLPEGYNRALAQIEAEYFVLLNSDVEVKDDWISPMLQYLDTHPEVAACQPKILSWHAPDKFEYAGAAGGYMDAWGYPYCRGRIMNTVGKPMRGNTILWHLFLGHRSRFDGT